MLKIPIPEVYKCHTCGKEWLQRILAKYQDDGLKIKRIEALKKPKTCTHCKSRLWDIPRT